MIKSFEDMIELMHTYWGGDDEVHKDLDKLLELHKKEITDVCKNCANSVTNYDECYLRAMELANDYLKNVNKPNTEYWLYKEIEGAVKYYHKKVMK